MSRLTNDDVTAVKIGEPIIWRKPSGGQTMKAKKCPYCRGTRIWEVHKWSGIKRYYMECAQCHWCGPDAITRKGAVLRWNLQKRYISKH